MDMKVIHADGSEETIPVELDTALLDKLSKIHAQTLILVSYSAELPTTDWLDETRELLSALGLLECLKELEPPSPSLRGLFKALKDACGSELLQAAIKHGDKFELNARTLEEIELHIDIGLCVYGLINPRELLACGDALLLLAKQIRDFADESNRSKPRWIQYGTFDPTKLENPILLFRALSTRAGILPLCPWQAYLPLYDLFQGDKVQIDGRDFLNFSLWVQPENQDGHCWSPKDVFDINGDISTLPVVTPNLPKTPSAMPPTV
jgi:hypothetical protein